MTTSSSSATVRNVAKNLKQFRLITFDVTDTLLKFRRPPAVEYVRVAATFGHQDVQPEQLTPLFRNHFKRMAHEYPNFGRDHRMDWQDWWRQLIGNILREAKPTIPTADIRRIADRLIDDYQTAECWCKLPAANQLIDTIRQDGTNKSIGIISNFDPRLSVLLKRITLPDFDFVLTSYEAGTAKPNANIFKMAQHMAGTGIRPEQSLHIGNTPSLDYHGARAAGWRSVLITNDAPPIATAADCAVDDGHVFESLTSFLYSLENSTIKW